MISIYLYKLKMLGLEIDELVVQLFIDKTIHSTSLSCFLLLLRSDTIIICGQDGVPIII